MLFCPLCRIAFAQDETVCPRDGSEPVEREPFPLPATVAARFQVVEPFADGDAGTLYVADDQDTGRRGLLKLFRGASSWTVSERGRLRRELLKQSTLDFAGLGVPAATGEADNVVWMFRQRFEGVSLAVQLARQGALAVDETLVIVAQVAGALDELHRTGLLQRDLSPGHIIIDTSGELPRVALIDPGIAMRVPTASGVADVTGKIGYIAPEHAGGKLLSFRSDLYALGCIFHEMLSGAPLFPGSFEDVVAAQSQPIVAPDAALPEPVAALVKQLLLREPRDRPFSAQQVRRTLEPHLPANWQTFTTPPAPSMGAARSVPAAKRTLVGFGAAQPPRPGLLAGAEPGKSAPPPFRRDADPTSQLSPEDLRFVTPFRSSMPPPPPPSALRTSVPPPPPPVNGQSRPSLPAVQMPAEELDQYEDLLEPEEANNEAEGEVIEELAPAAHTESGPAVPEEDEQEASAAASTLPEMEDEHPTHSDGSTNAPIQSLYDDGGRDAITTKTALQTAEPVAVVSGEEVTDREVARALADAAEAKASSESEGPSVGQQLDSLLGSRHRRPVVSATESSDGATVLRAAPAEPEWPDDEIPAPASPGDDEEEEPTSSVAANDELLRGGANAPSAFDEIPPSPTRIAAAPLGHTRRDENEEEPTRRLSALDAANALSNEEKFGLGATLFSLASAAVLVLVYLVAGPGDGRPAESESEEPIYAASSPGAYEASAANSDDGAPIVAHLDDVLGDDDSAEVADTEIAVAASEEAVEETSSDAVVTELAETELEEPAVDSTAEEPSDTSMDEPAEPQPTYAAAASNSAPNSDRADSDRSTERSVGDRSSTGRSSSGGTRSSSGGSSGPSSSRASNVSASASSQPSNRARSSNSRSFAQLRDEARDHYRARRYNDAANSYEAAARLEPQNASAWAGLGASRLQAGNPNGALDAYREAVRISPTARYYVAMGRAYAAAGNQTFARRAFERALQLDPGNRDARDQLNRM